MYTNEAESNVTRLGVKFVNFSPRILITIPFRGHNVREWKRNVTEMR